MRSVATQIRLYPNKAQAHDFRRFQGGLRRLWNDMLAASKAQREATGKSMNKRELQDFAVAWKKAPETSWGSELPAHAVLAIAADMHRAFVNFHEKRARFPRFRGKHHRQFSIYAVNQSTSFEGGAVKLPKMQPMRWRGGDLPQGRLLSARIWQDAGERWMMSAVFECDDLDAVEPVVERVGIDMGVGKLATVFDGSGFETIAAPKRLRKSMRRMKRLQRTLSRRQKGSRRREKAKAAIANLHRRIRQQRKDHAHQATGRIVRRAAQIHVETLNVRGMAKNHTLALSVADAGMSEFMRQLRYKAEWHGRALVEASQWFASSQTCSSCGEKNAAMKNLSRRTFRCGCGHEMDRDENAAVNLFHYGEERRSTVAKAARGKLVERREQAAASVPRSRCASTKRESCRQEAA